MSAIAYPSTFQVSHTRDVLYSMTAMVDASGPTNIATFTWQGASRLATTSNQNGTGTDYVYDGFRNVGSIDHTLVGGGSLHKFEYAYDKVHNRRMEKNTFNATWMATLPAAVQTFLNGRNGKGDVYAYDMAYRLVDARYDVTNPLTEVQNPGTQAFVTTRPVHDRRARNRSQVATTPPTPPTQVMYATDVVNQYTTVGGTTRSHDNNGNLTDDSTYKFGYDFENRLVELRNSTTSALIAERTATMRSAAGSRRRSTAAPRRATCSRACRSSRSTTAATSGRRDTSTRTASTSHAAWTVPTSRT